MQKLTNKRRVCSLVLWSDLWSWNKFQLTQEKQTSQTPPGFLQKTALVVLIKQPLHYIKNDRLISPECYCLISTGGWRCLQAGNLPRAGEMMLVCCENAAQLDQSFQKERAFPGILYLKRTPKPSTWYRGLETFPVKVHEPHIAKTASP